MNAATRSPLPTPSARNRCRDLRDLARSSLQESAMRSPRSLPNTSAVPLASCSSRLAAKFNRAPRTTARRASATPSRNTLSYGATACMPQNRQAAAQNSAGDSMLQA